MKNFLNLFLFLSIRKLKFVYCPDSFLKYLSVLNILENNKTYINTNPKCEPQLGSRGLYSATGGKSHTIEDQMALLWVLNLSDGSHTLLDIAERSALEFSLVKTAADKLLEHELLKESS